MDKKQAEQLIRNLFTQTFGMEPYQQFLKNLLNGFEPRDRHYTGNYIPEAFRSHINQYWRIGKYTDPDGEELDLLVVEVKSMTKLERARSSLRNFAVNRLKQFEKNASLVAFYARDDGGADWRFSFVRIEDEAYKDAKGKVRIKQELTPARRYSYLVGVHENSHTACKQLLPLLSMDYADPRIDDIESAFSIETVTKEFFDQYKSLFQKLAEHLKKQPWFVRESDEETDQAVSRFAKKLLGQIVFLYFLQKKGWLGAARGKAWGEGSKKFLRERFEQVTASGGAYYSDFLQYLFYEALACERKDQDDPGYYTRFGCRVPFLNGGLFEADYDWEKEVIEIPDTLFHNDEKTKAGDTGTGILDVFDRYNFTIKEDEPLDKEVAVDPEMLGKVFENMLEITERKSKGAFYTPREIVHYMCQESLIHYLDTCLNPVDGASGAGLKPKVIRKIPIPSDQKPKNILVPKEDLEALIRNGFLFIENDETAQSAIQRIEKGIQKSTKHKVGIPKAVKDNAGIIDKALADIKVCDPAIGSGAFPVGMLHEIVAARLALAPYSGITLNAYELKRHAIAESLYGVDIDASAIDIARLRLWLSMIVDEEDYDSIEPLPNLDYKIVQGDSLVGFPENYQSPALRKIEDLKNQFFNETGHDKKNSLKKAIDAEIQNRLDGSKQFAGYQVNFDFRLIFSEIWNSPEKKGGFDIVIGNPPYVFGGSTKISKDHKIYFKKHYFSGGKKINLFTLFIEKGINLLNYGSNLSYIIPNTLLRVTSYSGIREYVVKKSEIKEIVDLDVGVFDNVTASTIIIFLKNSKSINSPSNRIAIKKGINDSPMQLIEQSCFDQQGYIFDIFSDSKDRMILAAFDKTGNNLGKIASLIRFGVVISGNFNEVVSDEKHDSLWKPFLEGDEIGSYILNYGGRFLYYNKELLHRSRTPDLFENPKIMVQRITGGSNPIKATIDTKGFYNKESIINIIVNEDLYSLYTLLALLNSEAINWYYAKRFTNFSKLTVNLSKEYLSEIPIPRIDSISTEAIALLVKYILFCDESHSKLMQSFFKQLVNGIVYELYFPDDIKTAGKEILPHLGELTQISDDMSDEEKLAVIQREFERLYDPNHPVRNHLETLDSVDVVRTIRETLKR